MYTNEQRWYQSFFEAFEESGDVKLAAEDAKISRARVYQCRDSDPGFRIRFDEVRAKYDEDRRIERRRKAKLEIEALHSKMSEAENEVEQKKRIIAEVARETGAINKACAAADVSYTTFYRWRRDDPMFSKSVGCKR